MAGTRKDLIDMMPYWLQKDDGSGDWARWMEILQASMTNAHAILDRMKNAFDVDLCDMEALVNAMLDNLGNPFDVSRLSLTQKRLLVRGLLDLYQTFGTDDAVRSVVSIFTTLTVTSIIRGSFTGWELGVDVIGDGIHPIDFSTPSDFIVLYPSRLFQIYSFAITTDYAPSQAQRDEIARLMDVVKPAHLHYLGVAGWDPTTIYLNWEIGISEIGVTSDVH